MLPPYAILHRRFSVKLPLFDEKKQEFFRQKTDERHYTARFDGKLKLENCFDCSVAQLFVLHNTRAEKFSVIDKKEKKGECRVYKKKETKPLLRPCNNSYKRVCPMLSSTADPLHGCRRKYHPFRKASDKASRYAPSFPCLQTHSYGISTVNIISTTLLVLLLTKL